MQPAKAFYLCLSIKESQRGRGVADKLDRSTFHHGKKTGKQGTFHKTVNKPNLQLLDGVTKTTIRE